MNKSRFTPLLLALGVIGGILVGTFYANHFSGNRLRIINTGSNKLNYLLQLIDNNYVDTVDMQSLVEDAMPQILGELDPHSSYISANDAVQADEDLKGSFSGIGVSFTIQKDTVNVMSVIKGGPSEKIGLLAGDRIVTADTVNLVGMQDTEVMKHLKGEKGSHVRLGIRRHGTPETIYFNVIRGDIPIESVDAAYMIRPGVGFIRLSSFGMTSGTEVRDAIVKLKGEGMQSLILDLEENGGGYMQAAVNIASEFLQQNDMIVYTDGRSVPHQEMRSTGGGQFLDGKLIVLVNDYSASAAEIVAGAIQDQDRGFVVGRRTFGKGLVQRPIEFPDGSMIRLTVSHYYTPSGRCIQKPYEKGKKRQYEEDLMNRFKGGEMMHVDSIHFADSLKFKTLRQGRTVYGGGGIMPDYFVPLDTTVYTNLYRQLNLKSITINAHMKYVDAHRKALKKRYKKFDQFNAEYQVPQEEIDSVFSAAARMGVTPKDEVEKEQTLPKLRLVLKALVARDLWDMSEYFAIINEDSPTVHKALELIANKPE